MTLLNLQIVLSYLRKISFIILCAYLVCFKFIGLNLPKILLLFYPAFLLISFFFWLFVCKLFQSSKYGKDNTFIEMLLMNDTPMNWDTRRQGRAWNVWHYRHDDRSSNAGILVWLIRLAIIFVVAITILGLALFFII